MLAWTTCVSRPANVARRTFRYLSSASEHPVLDSKAYSKTLLLPKTSFPLWADPSKSEAPFRRKTSDELYRWQSEHAQGPLFVLHDGPPYANGNLHMGHALNKILKDIINRFHVLQGRRIDYRPGWDCHGLPIENKTLKELGREHHDLSPSTIRTAAKSVAEREIQTQCEEFQQLGIMADWSKEGTYRTLDHDYEIRQLRMFQDMVGKGLIYRHYRPVHYSPSSRSALAEAELSYRDDHVSRSVYVAFQLNAQSDEISIPLLELLASHNDVKVMVWTTTPWTLTANMGIAVHPELTYSVLRRSEGGAIIIVARDRKDALSDILGPNKEIATLSGSDLVDATYSPLYPSNHIQPLKIIPATHVTADSGTGLVHCAPAHGAEDYLAFRALGLLHSSDSLICHVDGEGKFNSKVIDVAGQKYGETLVGREVLWKGTGAVIESLRELGVLMKEEKIKHRYPYDWKTDKPVIVTATSQWFANLDKIKDIALSSLNDVSFHPPSSRTRLESFVRSRSEWCISRQRVWGVPIPWLHHLPTDRAILDAHTLTHILAILEAKGVAYWWDGSADEFVPDALRCELGGGEGVWRKGTDTMDVWFDSGSSWSLLRAAGVRSASAGYAGRCFADVCVEGSDQHRGWFQSLLLTATATSDPSRDAVRPYGTLVTHGMVLDQEGKKMSKSVGNVISPLTVIQGGKDRKKEPAYGADLLRFWVASSEYWRDMALGPTVLAQASEAMRKLRNSARFILGNIGDVKSRENFDRVDRRDMGIADRYVMHELCKLDSIAREGYATYNFPRVVTTLTNFANITLSSLYFDITKDCLYADRKDSLQRRAIVTVLEQVLTTMIGVMAPVVPHLAEEIYCNLQGCEGDESQNLSMFMQGWPLLSAGWEDVQVEQEMIELLRVRSVILSLLEKARTAKNIRSSLEAEVDIILPNGLSHDIGLVKLLKREEGFLKTLCIVSDASIVDEGSLRANPQGWSFSGSISIPNVDELLGIRVRPTRLEKCPRCWTFTRPAEAKLCSRCAGVV